MIPRLHIQDWRVIGHYMGALIVLMAGAMLVPLILSIILGEIDALVDFVASIGVALIVGALLLYCRIERGPMSWHQALIITGLSWLVLSFVGTFPFWLSGHYASFLDAYFEGISALTATGLSLVIDIDHMALSLLTWRIIMHLMGGIGVLVVALALGIFGSGAGVAALYQAEGRSDHVLPEIKQTSRFIIKVSTVIIVAGIVVLFVPLLVQGQGPAEALLNAFWLSISSFATGGMTGSSMGVMYYHSWALEIISVFIMFFGVINFILYGDLWKGLVSRFFKDIEIRTLGLWIAFLMILMAFALMGVSYFTDFPSMLRRALFTIIAAATNTGFSTIYPGQLLYAMSSGALFVVLLAMAVGGSASSTTGGIKALRIGIVAKTIAQTVRFALAPDRARPRTFFFHQKKQLLNPELASSALSILLLYLLTFAVGSIAGIAYGYDALSSIFESVSAASNAGLTTGIISGGMPIGLEIVYMIEMWLGRLEFIAAFAMIVQFVTSLIPREKRQQIHNKRDELREKHDVKRTH